MRRPRGHGGALLLAAASLAASAAAQAPLGSAFTYQGRLADASGPVTGSYDLRFTLFDAASAGNPIGTPVTSSAVAVTQGLFSVTLDFGASALGGSARWLAIEVRPAGGGAFTLLSPRQRLTPAPGAVFSSFTDPANLTTLNAGNLTAGTIPDARLAGTFTQGLAFPNPANTFSGTFTGNGLALTALNAGSLTAGTVPGTAIAGAYPNAVSFSNPANSFTGNGAGLTNLNAQPRYVRSVVVSPTGAPLADGAALRAALAAITGASATSPWLLKIEPGLYDLGSSSLDMKAYVDVEGSGEPVTRITAAGNAGNAVGTVNAADHAELRWLTVENRGGAAYAKAVFVNGVPGRLAHVTARAFGASTENQGVYLNNPAAGSVLDGVTADATAAGAARSYGVLVIGVGGVGTPTLRNVSATATGGAEAHGLFNFGANVPLVLNTVVQGLSATGLNRGITSVDAAPTLLNVSAVATGSSSFADGIASFGTAAPRMQNVRAFASTGSGQATGIYNGPGTTPWLSGVYTEANGGTAAWGLNNDGVGGATLDFLTAVAYGSGTTSTTAGVRNSNSSPVISHLTVVANFGVDVAGVLNVSSSFPTINQAQIRAGVGTNNYGVRTMGGGQLSLSGAFVQGFSGAQAYGIANESASASLTQVTAEGLAASGTNAGILNSSAVTVALRTVHARGGGGTISNGMRNVGSAATVTVDGSVLSGSSSAVGNQSATNVSIGASKLMGVFNNAGGGTVVCHGAYNASYQGLSATCQ